MTRITEERLENIFNNLVEELDLDYGNAGSDHFDEDGRFVGYVEAPNNTTIAIDIDFDLDEEMTDKEIREEFLYYIKKAINNFDPEETFNEIWQPSFEFSVFEFVDMLREDEEFFNEIADEL